MQIARTWLIQTDSCLRNHMGVLKSRSKIFRSQSSLTLLFALLSFVFVLVFSRTLSLNNAYHTYPTGDGQADLKAKVLKWQGLVPDRPRTRQTNTDKQAATPESYLSVPQLFAFENDLALEIPNTNKPRSTKMLSSTDTNSIDR